MRKINVIGADVAKNVIQVSVESGLHRELSNTSYTRKKFAELLVRQFAAYLQCWSRERAPMCAASKNRRPRKIGGYKP